jgi:hypothetical protein
MVRLLFFAVHPADALRPLAKLYAGDGEVIRTCFFIASHYLLMYYGCDAPLAQYVDQGFHPEPDKKT